MATLRISSKGQVTFKQSVLRHLGLKPGDQVQVELLPESGVSLRPIHPTGSVDALFGLLKDEGRSEAATIEEIEQAIADGWGGHGAVKV